MQTAIRSNPLYGATIFLSAGLLFQIQPLLAKLILPWYGGAAAVWIVSLAFYQLVYSLGNLYAHIMLRGRARRLSSRIHALALLGSLIFLPILPNAFWKPVGSEDPAWRIIWLLAATVGVPFLLLSATSSLLQSWYASARSSAYPYRFYALSNAGSLLALLTYPFLVEPLISTHRQAIVWSFGYVGFVVLCVAVALTRTREEHPSIETKASRRPAFAVLTLWFCLSATASALLLAITNHVSQNIAAVPLLWIAPLSLYLFSLILCFENSRWYRRDYFLPLLAVALAGMIYLLSPKFDNASPAAQILVFFGGLFICCMACNGEVAALKPPAEYLSLFYLLLAAGGACGGLFVAIIAPGLFSHFYELPLALGMCAVFVLAALLFHSKHYPSRTKSRRPLPLVATLVTAALLIFVFYVQGQSGQALLTIRNFYGVLRVGIVPGGSRRPAVTQLRHGTIVHGEEIIEEARNDVPTTYYGEHSGAGISLLLERQRGNLQVGVIGLGIGTLARYGQKGDHYVFYEINPQVIDLAQNLFDFLRQSEAQVEIVPGDARLSLEKESSRQFDALVVDAFSGDAIPVHLLTREAFALYFQRLKPNGLLAIHVTNRFLDIDRVVAAAASATGARTITVLNSEDEPNAVYASKWMLLDRDTSPNPTVSALIHSELSLPPGTSAQTASTSLRPWTDDYSNLIQIVKW